MQEDGHQEWFECWFDTPYYHLLYKNRDLSEAELFIDNLIGLLQPEKNFRFLDLACGKGRHSIYLNKKEFDVTGVDLSDRSIECAKHFENEHLHFYVHDMRKLFRTNYFDVVLNLFTSFGYFRNERDNKAVIRSASKALKQDGLFVLDFMNSKKVIANLKGSETKEIDGIEFHISKKVENNAIIKLIEFTDKGKKHCYTEYVKAFTLKDLKKYFEENGLKIVHLLGNYKLEEFDENTSDRLILVGRKA